MIFHKPDKFSTSYPMQIIPLFFSTMSNFTNAYNDADALINEEELYTINEWLEINKLAINFIKSKFMVFLMPKKM